MYLTKFLSEVLESLVILSDILNYNKENSMNKKVTLVRTNFQRIFTYLIKSFTYTLCFYKRFKNTLQYKRANILSRKIVFCCCFDDNNQKIWAFKLGCIFYLSLYCVISHNHLPILNSKGFRITYQLSITHFHSFFIQFSLAHSRSSAFTFCDCQIFVASCRKVFEYWS